MCLDEEEFKQIDKALHLYMIEQSFATKQLTEDDLISHFMINSNPSLDFMELFSSICATQKIDITSISSVSPDINSNILTDFVIK